MRQLLKTFYLLFSVLFSLSLAAQESSVKAESDSKNMFLTQGKRVLLFPFEETMYMSDGSDKELVDSSALSQKEFAEKLRTDFDIALFHALKGTGKACISFHNSNNEGVRKDLNKVRASIAYKYVALNTVVKGKEKKPAKPNGQLTDTKETGPKYMNAAVEPDDKEGNRIMEVISKKYDSSYLIFINQFEIKYDAKDAAEMVYDMQRRQIKVHYTIMSPDLKQVAGGIAKVSMPRSVVNSKMIEQKYFPELCNQIINSIPKN